MTEHIPYDDSVRTRAIATLNRLRPGGGDELDRLFNDELHLAYGRGYDEGFKDGYADRSVELPPYTD